VKGIADDPVFTGLQDEYHIDEDSINATIIFAISDVETQQKSLMMQAVSLNETVIKSSGITIEGLGDDNSAVTLKLTPEANVNGFTDITLSLGDGFAVVQKTIRVYVDNVNDAPSAITDEITYTEDCEPFIILTSTLIQNDTDIDNDTLNFVDNVSSPAHGTLTPTDESKTSYLYTPEENFDGETSFTYSVSDGTATATGTCVLTATPVNDAPVITLEQAAYQTYEDQSTGDITFAIYDEETDAANLILTAGSQDTHLLLDSSITLTNNGDGTATIAMTPAADAYGTVNVLLTISDGNTSATKILTLQITPQQDAPIAVNDTVYVGFSGKVSFSELTNDRDADGDTLSVSGYDATSLNGLITFDEATQLFTYTAVDGEVGISVFSYYVSDGNSGTEDAMGTVTLNIHSAGHAP
jgi:hypothetical protein